MPRETLLLFEHTLSLYLQRKTPCGWPHRVSGMVLVKTQASRMMVMEEFPRLEAEHIALPSHTAQTQGPVRNKNITVLLQTCSQCVQYRQKVRNRRDLEHTLRNKQRG